MTRFALALAAGVLAGPAFAAPITYDFTNPGAPVPSLVLGPLTVTPLAATVPGLWEPTTILLTQNTGGLGVDWTGTSGTFTADTDPDQVDGFGADESVRFTFSSPQVLESITIRTEDFNGVFPFEELFDLYVDGNLVVSDRLVNPGGTGGGAALFTISLADIPAGLRTGSVFEITPSADGRDFRIAAITVSAVPEPATLAVFGLLAAGGFVARRRRTAGV